MKKKASTLKVKTRAAEVHPNGIASLLHEGMRKQTAGDATGAEACYRRVLAERPQDYEALHLLGVLESGRGNNERAVELIEQAVSLQGGTSPYFAMNYGMALHKLGRNEEAEVQLRKAADQLPESAQAQFTLATLLQNLKRFVDAKSLYKKALSIDEGHVLSWHNLGKIYDEEGNLDAAIDCYKKAIELHPGFVDSQVNLGCTLRDQYRLSESYQVHVKALTFDPNNLSALSNIALTCRQMGLMDQAIGYYGRLLMLDLDDFYAHYNLALLLLEMGDLVNGWAEFEYRWRDARATATTLRPFPQPVWNGEDLTGKTLLVWGEQGVGDHIRYSSVIPDLAARARRVLVETDPRLVTLLARSFPQATILPWQESPSPELTCDEVDFQVPMVSCARWTRTRLEDFPEAPAYLVADVRKRQRWSERFAQLPPGLKIGISWRSGFTTMGRQYCYAEIERWLPLFRVPGVVFVNLQYDDCGAELERIRDLGGPTIHQWDDIDLKDDFDDVAALISELDLVISAPISVAELSGALGIPTWILLLNHVAYVTHGTDGFPWHPSVRLFRREWDEAWEPVVAQMAEALRRLALGTVDPVRALSPAERANQQGIAAYQAGAFEEAIRQFRIAAELSPACADYPSNQGSALQAAGRLVEAETLFRQALAADPHHVNSYFNLGNLLKAQGRFDEAEAAYRRALDIDPSGEGAWNNLGTMLLELGRHAEAVAAFEQALAQTPDDARAHSNIALALKPLGRKADAEDHLRRAVALAPDFAEAHNNLGNLLTDAQRHDEAIDSFLRALDAKPDYLDAVFNLGYAYRDNYQLDEATQCFETLLEHQPDNGRALNGLGSVLTIQGRLADAAGLFMRALAARFDDYDAHCNLGQAVLQMGDLTNGWEGYAQRFFRERQPVRTRPFPMPWWDGGALAGKTLLIWGEQGVGDELRFASMVPDAAAQAEHCLLECDPRLAPLFARSFPSVRVVPRSDPPTALHADLQCPSADLARWLRRDFASFTGMPYLRPDPRQVDAWRQRLAALPTGRRIGFAWRSRNLNRQRVECYPPLEAWRPLFELPGIVWIDLQYDPNPEEAEQVAAALGVPLHRFDDLDVTDDFDAVAALMANLDAVVSVATAVPELSGALGIPSYVIELAHFSAMSLGQPQSPWHASRRTFPRAIGTPWEPVITEMLHAIADVQTTFPAAPPDTQALFREGMETHQAGDLEAAANLYHRVLAIDPNHADALHLSGVLAHQRGQHEEAETLIRQAIRINPRVPWYFSNLGNVCKALGRLDAAVIELRRAVALDPGFADAHYNLANILREQGLLEGAEDHYRRAVALEPENGTFQSNLAFILLQQGKLEEGWKMHDLWRWGGPTAEGAFGPRRLPQPAWSGEPLVGRSIAVWAEQGVGDEIRFASMFDDVVKQAGHALIECDARLLPLFRRSWPQARFVGRAAEPDPALADGAIDFQCASGGLARWLRPDLASFPGTAYLKPDPELAHKWKQRLDELGKGLKVGVCWRSQLRTEQRNRSYADIADWYPVFAVPGVVFVSLQYGDCDEELDSIAAATRTTLHRWSDIDLMNDFDQVAALVSGLDVVISAPVATAELAGALGVRTWSLFYAHESPMELGTGPTVPWYARLRKFVRAAGQGWRDVLEAVAASLHSRADRRFDLGAVGAQWGLEGKRALEQRNFPAAIAKLRKTLLVAADNPQARHLLGVALLQSGFHELGEKAIRAALPYEKNPATLAVMWSNLGAALEGLGRIEDAEAAFRSAARCNPRHAEAYYNLARLFGFQNRWDEAVELYRKVIELNPNIAEAYNNIGNWLMEQKGDAEGALPYFEKAVAIGPTDPINQYNLGKAWQDLFELDKAVPCYRRAIALKSDYSKPYNNLGACLRYMGRIDEAMAMFDRVFEINPTDLEGLFNTGFIRLLQGELGRGWDLLEYRWLLQSAKKKRPFPQPWWDGTPLGNKRILVWGDQGVGDEIRAFSMLPDLVAAGADVHVECDPRLVGLVRRSFSQITVYPREAVPVAPLRDLEADFQCCASGLSRWLRRDLANFPPRPSYFLAAPERGDHWRQRLAALGPGLKVGISWRSRLMTRERRRSYTSLDQWGPVFAIPGVHFVNLQYDQCEDEVRAAERKFGIRIHRWPELDLMNHLDEVAALNANLDLVITAPTAVGELSGALGIPTWTMLLKHESAMDLGTGRMPWQPSVKLYYRNWDDAWERIIDLVTADLRTLAGKTST